MTVTTATVSPDISNRHYQAASTGVISGGGVDDQPKQQYFVAQSQVPTNEFIKLKLMAENFEKIKKL